MNAKTNLTAIIHFYVGILLSLVVLKIFGILILTWEEVFLVFLAFLGGFILISFLIAIIVLLFVWLRNR